MTNNFDTELLTLPDGRETLVVLVDTPDGPKHVNVYRSPTGDKVRAWIGKLEWVV